MPSREYHKIRIEELKFKRDVKRNADNRIHSTLTALVSITVVMLIFELGSKEKSIGWLFVLFLCFIVTVIAINRDVKYKEDRLLQKNFNILLGRKKQTKSKTI